jgi:hypothetical protein
MRNVYNPTCHHVLTQSNRFLYMVAELSAVGQTVTALTGMDGLPVIIVQCVVTTLYTCMYHDETRVAFY